MSISELLSFCSELSDAPELVRDILGYVAKYAERYNVSLYAAAYLTPHKQKKKERKISLLCADKERRIEVGVTCELGRPRIL